MPKVGGRRVQICVKLEKSKKSKIVIARESLIFPESICVQVWKMHRNL